MVKICTFEGCTNAVLNLKRGLCAAHYAQWWRTGELKPIRQYIKASQSDHKVCSRCKVEKPHSEFYKHSKSGLQSNCKECMKASQVARNKARKRAAA